MESLKIKLLIGIDPKTKMGGINYRLKVLYDDGRLTIQICILPLPWPFLQHYSVFYETQLLTCVKATKLANFQIASWHYFRPK